MFMQCAEKYQSRSFFAKPMQLIQGVKSVFSKNKGQDYAMECSDKCEEEFEDEDMCLDDIGFCDAGVKKKDKESDFCPEKEVDESDLFQDLVDLQGSSGLFKWGKAMEKAFKMKEDEIKPEMNVEKEIWITALVVAYFEKKMPEKKDLWELIVEKAVKEMKKKTENVTEILERAAKFVHQM